MWVVESTVIAGKEKRDEREDEDSRGMSEFTRMAVNIICFEHKMFREIP